MTMLDDYHKFLDEGTAKGLTLKQLAAVKNVTYDSITQAIKRLRNKGILPRDYHYPIKGHPGTKAQTITVPMKKVGTSIRDELKQFIMQRLEGYSDSELLTIFSTLR